MYEIMVEDTFDAAHQLVGYNGPCENLHGHGWKVQVHISGNKLNDQGMLVDFKEIKADLNQILSKLDHSNLNDLPEFKKTNPTSENFRTAKLFRSSFRSSSNSRSISSWLFAY